MEQRNQENDLKIILPAKGRLRDAFNALMDVAALGFARSGERIDSGVTTDRRDQIPALKTFLERPEDALQTLLDGVADLAVVGLDRYLEFTLGIEKGVAPNLLLKFNTAAACKLCIAGPKERVFENEKGLNGLRFATSFPLILTRWLAAHDITPKSVLLRTGGVEATIAQGRADVICDLVQSGDSLKANNLKSRFVVQDNLCPVLIGRKGVWSENQITVANLLMRRLEQANKMGQQQQSLRTFPAQIA